MVNIGSFAPRLLPSVEVGSGTVGPERPPQTPLRNPPAAAEPAPPRARPTPEQSSDARARHAASATAHGHQVGRTEQQLRHVNQELNANPPRPETLAAEIRSTLATPSRVPTARHSQELSDFRDRLDRREDLSATDRSRLAYLMQTYAPPGTR